MSIPDDYIDRLDYDHISDLSEPDLTREEILHRVKEISFTLNNLPRDALLKIIKSSYDTSDVLDYEILTIIDNFKTSIKNIGENLNIQDVKTNSLIFKKDNWTKEKMLGSGAYGSVYKMSKDGEYIAFKEMDASEGVSDDFIREVGCYAILTYIGAEKIPKFVGFGLENLGYAVELASQNLEYFIYEDPLSKKSYYKVFDDTLEALHEIQSVGIVHGDIKLENILVWTEGKEIVKATIADFGLASSYPRHGPELYTWPYRSPEIWNGGIGSFASDCWAFAMTMLNFSIERNYYRSQNDYIEKPVPNEKTYTKTKEKFGKERSDLINNMFLGRCIKRVTTKIPKRDTTVLYIYPEYFNQFDQTLNYIVDSVKETTPVLAKDIAMRYHKIVEPEMANVESVVVACLLIACKWSFEELDFDDLRSIKNVNYLQVQLKIKDIVTKLNGLIWIPGL